jgi:type II secretion system protein L
LADTLFLRLSASGAATWGAFDATGRLVSGIGRGDLERARGEIAGRRCAVLVDGIDVLTAQVDLPAASQTRLRQIAPFSLEESLADDLEHLVFAIGARLSTGATEVAAIAKERLETWLGQLRAAGIVPQVVCSEADGVPDIPATLVLVLEGDRIAGRKPGQPPFIFEGIGLRQVLDLVVGPRTPEMELRHVRVFVDDATRTPFRAELARLGDEFASSEIKVLGDGVFPHLAATLAQRGGTNLLQGPYAPKSNWLALARPWRLAASLIVASALLLVALRGAEYWQLRRVDAELSALAGDACARVVGNASASVCEREVRQRIGASAGTSSETFLSTLAAIAAARSPDARIEALSYRNRAMDLQLIMPSVSALDEFSRALEQTRRFDVEIEAANQNQDGTEGRLRIVGVNP